MVALIKGLRCLDHNSVPPPIYPAAIAHALAPLGLENPWGLVGWDWRRPPARSGLNRRFDRCQQSLDLQIDPIRGRR